MRTLAIFCLIYLSYPALAAEKTNSLTGLRQKVRISSHDFAWIKVDGQVFLFRDDPTLAGSRPHCALTTPPDTGAQAMAERVGPERVVQVSKKELSEWRANCKPVKNWKDFDMSLGLPTGKDNSVEMQNKPGETSVQWQLRF
jgi:hypothetical protein